MAKCICRYTDAMPGSRAQAAHSTQVKILFKNVLLDGKGPLLKTCKSAPSIRDALMQSRAPRRKRTLASQETPNPDRVGTRIELCIPQITHAQCKHHGPQAPTASKCDLELESACCNFKYGYGNLPSTDYDENPNSWGLSAIDALHHGKSEEECR